MRYGLLLGQYVLVLVNFYCIVASTCGAAVYYLLLPHRCLAIDGKMLDTLIDLPNSVDRKLLKFHEIIRVSGDALEVDVFPE